MQAELDLNRGKCTEINVTNESLQRRNDGFVKERTEVTRRTKLELCGELNGVLEGLKPHTLKQF
jgi:hypothetical protein